MRTEGSLFHRIPERENLRRATARAMRSKRAHAVVRRFTESLEKSLTALREEIRSGTAVRDPYQSFIIRDPKTRRICAPSFRERVLHHAVMNICEPTFERYAISQSYACRVEKGQTAAVRAAKSHATQGKWFVKLDVCK